MGRGKYANRNQKVQYTVAEVCLQSASTIANRMPAHDCAVLMATTQLCESEFCDDIIPKPQNGSLPTAMHRRSIRSNRAWRHEVDDERSSLSVCAVGQRAMEAAAVVEDGATSGQRCQDLGLADVEDWVYVFLPVSIPVLTVATWHRDAFKACSERAWNHTQSPVVFAHIVQRDPAAQEVGWLTFPISVILMPLHVATCVQRKSAARTL